MFKKLIVFSLIFITQKSFSDEIVSGNQDSPVTIIEYGSLTCDHCIGFHRKVLPKINDKYIASGKVRFIYRHYPTSKVALQAAIAVECSNENGYEVLNSFYFNIKDWYSPKNRGEAFKKHAQIKENDTARFETCLKNKEIRKKIIAVQKAAYEEYGVHGTPTFIINEQVFKGEHSLEDLDKIIRKKLADYE